MFYTERVRKQDVAPVRYVRATPYRLGMAGSNIPSLLFVLTSRHVARSGRERVTSPVP